MQATVPIKICNPFGSWNDAASPQRVTDAVPNLIYVFNHQTLTNDYSNRSLGEVLGYSGGEMARIESSARHETVGWVWPLSGRDARGAATHHFGSAVGFIFCCRTLSAMLQSSYEGHGLGLAICRRIAANHSSDITLVSSRGEGAEFTVRLPLA